MEVEWESLLRSDHEEILRNEYALIRTIQSVFILFILSISSTVIDFILSIKSFLTSFVYKIPVLISESAFSISISLFFYWNKFDHID